MNRLLKKDLYIRLLRSKIFLAVFVIFISILIIKICPPINNQRLNNDYAKIFFSRNNEIMYIKTSQSGKYRLKKNLSDISPILIKSIINTEDKYFYYHPGINPISIVKSFYINIKSQSIVTGASTITMQLVRLNSKKFNNIYIRKVYELFVSILYEIKYSKKEILQYYLNSVPMGGNIEGIEAASLFYFSKQSKYLNYGEAATLLAILNNPSNFNLDNKANKNKLIFKRSNILERWVKQDFISKAEAKNYKKYGIYLNKINSQPIAIHYCLKLSSLYPKKYEFYTPIDIEIQQDLEKMVTDKILESGANNGAVIVYDNNSNQLIAYVGNGAFSKSKNNMINGASVYRQPGSLLKPFIYASSFDHLGYYPKLAIRDIPIDINGYKPNNFSNKFMGLVKLETALRLSLNIPAVYTHTQLNKENNLYGILKKCNILDYNRKFEPYDHSVALGSFGLSLEELVQLYHLFVNKGVYQQINYFQDDKKEEAKTRNIKIFSEASCYLISEILKSVKKPYYDSVIEFTKDYYQYAYKTGTSHGGMDAWSIGYNKDYTIGVWIGNLDQSFDRGLVGFVDAAPLLHNIFKYMQFNSNNNKQDWFKKPENIKKRKLCAETGLLPTEYSPFITSGYFIEGISLYKKDNIHRPFYQNKYTGEIEQIENIDNFDDYELVIKSIYPSEIMDFMNETGLNKFKSQFKNNKKTLKIKNLYDNQIYYINGNQKNILLPLQIYNQSTLIKWYINKKHVIEANIDENIYYRFQQGKNTIEVYDNKGNKGEITIYVKTKKK